MPPAWHLAGVAVAALGAALWGPRAMLPAAADARPADAGLATVFPSVLAAASRLPDAEPAAGIAATSAAGYTGFLAGPPLIGVVADAVALRGGLGVVAGAALVIVGLSSTLRGPAR